MPSKSEQMIRECKVKYLEDRVKQVRKAFKRKRIRIVKVNELDQLVKRILAEIIDDLEVKRLEEETGLNLFFLHNIKIRR